MRLIELEFFFGKNRRFLPKNGQQNGQKNGRIKKLKKTRWA